MLTVNVETELYCCPTTLITIPDISDWSEVKEWYVKRSTFHYTLDGNTWLKIPLESEPYYDCIDWTLPIRTLIYKIDGGDIAFSELLSELEG